MKNYNEVIQSLIDTNEKLIAGEITPIVARQVANNVQVLINAARLQFEVMKYQKKETLPFFAQPEQMIIDRIKKSCSNCKRENLCKTSRKCTDDSLSMFEPKI
jgi:restriction endonuclease Mrr